MSQTPRNHNIVVIEDHQLVRDGLRCLLSNHPRFRIVGEASDGKAGIRLVEKLKPALVLLDLILPGVHGFQVLRKLRRLTRTLVISMRTDESFVTQAFHYGAGGYVAKEDSFAELVHAMDMVMKGERFISGSLDVRRITDSLQRRPSAAAAAEEYLTPREQEVLQMAAEGHTSSQMASGAVHQRADGRDASRQPHAQAEPPVPGRARALRNPQPHHPSLTWWRDVERNETRNALDLFEDQWPGSDREPQP